LDLVYNSYLPLADTGKVHFCHVRGQLFRFGTASLGVEVGFEPGSSDAISLSLFLTCHLIGLRLWARAFSAFSAGATATFARCSAARTWLCALAQSLRVRFSCAVTTGATGLGSTAEATMAKPTIAAPKMPHTRLRFVFSLNRKVNVLGRTAPTAARRTLK
jgi:hypothetical protein